MKHRNSIGALCAGVALLALSACTVTVNGPGPSALRGMGTLPMSTTLRYGQPFDLDTGRVAANSRAGDIWFEKGPGKGFIRPINRAAMRTVKKDAISAQACRTGRYRSRRYATPGPGNDWCFCVRTTENRLAGLCVENIGDGPFGKYLEISYERW